MSDVPFPSDPASEADTAAPNRIALFAFDEVRRFEIVAINRRRERHDRPPVGLPIRPVDETPRRERETFAPFTESFEPLSHDEVFQITSAPVVERRQTSIDPVLTRPQPIPSDMTGLSLSGGGIRSAAFSLGALQALHAHRALEGFDYLSTVSGGGYIGASMTAAMSRNNGEFPFAAGNADIRDAESVGHLRNFSNYIMPRGRSVFRNLGEALVVTLRGIAANVVMVAPPMLLTGLLFGSAWRKSNGFAETGFLSTIGGMIHPAMKNNVAVAAAVLSATLIATIFQRRHVAGHSFWPTFLALFTFAGMMIVVAMRDVPDLLVLTSETFALLSALHFGVLLVLAAVWLSVLVVWALLKSSDWSSGEDAGSFSLSFGNTLLWSTLICSVLELVPFSMRALRDWAYSEAQFIDGSDLRWFDHSAAITAAVLFAFATTVALMSDRLVAVADSRSGRRFGATLKKTLSRSALLLQRPSCLQVSSSLCFTLASSLRRRANWLDGAPCKAPRYSWCARSR